MRSDGVYVGSPVGFTVPTVGEHVSVARCGCCTDDQGQAVEAPARGRGHTKRRTKRKTKMETEGELRRLRRERIEMNRREH